MGARENEAVLRRWVESLNRGAPALEDTFASDAVVHLVGHDEVKDRDTFLSTLLVVAGAFPGLQFEIHDLVATDDTVAFRWTARGTHGGELLGTPASGRTIELEGGIIDQLRDGKIVRRWEQYDRLGLLQQIGALPTPSLAGSAA